MFSFFMHLYHAHSHSESLPGAELADLRLYVHGSQGVVPAGHILTIAFGTTTATLDAYFKCLPVTSPQLKDKVRKDKQCCLCLRDSALLHGANLVQTALICRFSNKHFQF